MKPRRMTLSAPLSCNVFKSKIAPKMMYSSDAATIRPCTEAAATWTTGTRHTSSASNAAIKYDSGIARLAGQRNTTRNNPTTTIGRNARRASIMRLVSRYRVCGEELDSQWIDCEGKRSNRIP